MLNGNSPAQTFIAADYATNSTYASGWSAGHNGGYGFGPWSMNGTEVTSPDEHAMDRTSPFNPFGVAWALYNPEGVTPAATSPGTQCVIDPVGSDISRAGRALPNGGLRPGDTFSAIIANPSTRRFFRGYTLILSTGSDNIQYGNVGLQVSVGHFEYFNNGAWTTSAGITSLFDTDTTTNGVQVDITLTGTNTFHAVMTPLGNPAIAYSTDGTLENKGLAEQGVVNWVTFQLYNTDSNFYPAAAECGPDRTDFYIKSMTVQGLSLNVKKAGTDVLLSWPSYDSAFKLESTSNLVPGAVWNPVLPDPVVIGGQNVVTNTIAGARQFYRLRLAQ